jgi:hypothetical protein
VVNHWRPGPPLYTGRPVPADDVDYGVTRPDDCAPPHVVGG